MSEPPSGGGPETAERDGMTGARRNGHGPAPERPEGARSPECRTVDAEGFA
jgi:hypothetical protein